MEEESEKRRERLKAMRMEMSNNNMGTPSSSMPQQQLQTLNNTPLANPMLDNDNPVVVAAPPSRFGFYTDPMAAFSPHPRPHFPPSSSPGPRNSGMTNSGAHQFHNNYAPHQSMHQGGDPYYSPRSNCPMGVRSPYPTNQVGDHSCSPGPSARPMGFRGPNPMYQGTPNFGSVPGRGQHFYNSPRPVSGGSPYAAYQGTPSFSPSLGRGRGGGPSPGGARGSGHWEGSRMSPGAGYSGGRGRGRDTYVQARSYYNKSMVEDPWESLSPVTWREENTGVEILYNRGPAMMTSHAKKARATHSSNVSNTQPSLAEFLAAAVDEAVDEAAAVDKAVDEAAEEDSAAV